MRPPRHPRPRAGHTTCPNCGRREIGDDAYCPACGQENRPLDLSLGHVLGELLESTIHFDSKIFRTVGALVFRPGSLTIAYAEGKRRRYVPPIRLYVFVSVLFFFLLSVLPGGEGAREEGRRSNQLNLSFYSVDGRELAGMNADQLDSIMVAHQIEPTAANRYAARKLAVIEEGGLGEFAHLLLKTISYMMFVLMPVFGLFVYLFYRRRALFYMRGLIYAVHLHSFIFLMLSVFLLAGRVMPVFAALGTEAALVVFYLGVSLHRIFGEGLVRTALKTAALSVLYVFLMVACFLVVVVTSIVLF